MANTKITQHVIADDAITTAMITYRQALRDITEETIPVVDWKNGIVSNVTWPTHEFVSDFDFKSAGINHLAPGQTT